MVTLPPWTVTVPIASNSEVTACHSMLWLTGCSKIWRSVFRWWLSRCGDSGEDDIVLPSGIEPTRGRRRESGVSRVLITGSTDGLGLMAARLLAHDGHDVTLHARNDTRAGDARDALPEGAEAVLIGDLTLTIEGMRSVAASRQAGWPATNAIIHNAAVGYREPSRIETADGLAHVFAVNVLAPYLLTALIALIRPARLVYLSSGMHRGGDTVSGRPPVGPPGPGTARGRTPTASCWTSFSRSRSPADGPTCCPTRSNPAGSRRRWEVRGAPRRPLPGAGGRRRGSP